MEYTTIPNTDLNVSRICLGTMQFAGSVEGGTSDVTWGSIDQATVNATVQAALDAGVNFFDGAEAYGKDNQAEKALGEAIRVSGKREEVIITSKFGKHLPLWETDDPQGAQVSYDAAMITQALDASLAALQTEYIDLYQVHWPGNMASHGECVEVLEAAKAARKIRHYGVCNFGTDDMAAFRAAGGAPVTNQLPYNLLWRSIEPRIVPCCIEGGMGILCYSPLQQGLLAGKTLSPEEVTEGRRRTRIYRPETSEKTCHGSPGMEEPVFGPHGALESLRGICQGAGCSMVDAALGWLIAQPGVSCVIVGASSPEQMTRNAKLPRIDPAVAQQCSEATAALKELVAQQGNFVDQYAPKSRINGT
jgi:myo-inositol catabolism protein IolS